MVSVVWIQVAITDRCLLKYIVNLIGQCCDKCCLVSCRKMVRRVGRVLVLIVGLPALTPTLLLKAVCATLATNIGGINYCVTY